MYNVIMLMLKTLKEIYILYYISGNICHRVNTEINHPKISRINFHGRDDLEKS